MMWRRAWLAVTTILFLGWLNWLAYLAITTAHPIVLSRPQLLASTLDVIAEVNADKEGRPNAHVTVREVHWPPGNKPGAGTILEVTNLARCENWDKPGLYILPLVPLDDGTGRYEVASIPASPGFEAWPPRARIYPLTPETERQR